jgi:signal transduction histidine kinase
MTAPIHNETVFNVKSCRQKPLGLGARRGIVAMAMLLGLTAAAPQRAHAQLALTVASAESETSSSGSNVAEVVRNGRAPYTPRFRSMVRLSVEPQKPVYAGEFAPGLDWQEIRFSTPASGRYFSIDTRSAWDGKPYAAIGELVLIDLSGQSISNKDWTVCYVDSEETRAEKALAENAFDGQADTFWHTRWSGGLLDDHPHRLVLDLGRSYWIAGFRYLPRQGNPGAAGRIKEYSVCLGDHLTKGKSPVELLPEQCYLFSHFTDNDQDGLHLSWSFDGYQWEDVNRGQSVLKPDPNLSTLMRDPCLLQTPDGVFHLVWTIDWAGNRIGYATSTNLIDWSEQRALPVMERYPATLHCWAPEIFWDKERSEFLLVWASTVTNLFLDTWNAAAGLNNDRIFCTTTRDFKTFSLTRLFYDPGFSVIDPTIFPIEDRFYLVFKDESALPPRKFLRMAESSSLHGPYGLPSEGFSPQLVEGPSLFDEGTNHVVYFHNYEVNRFGAVRSKDLKHWENVSDRLALPPGTHPGTVLKVSRKVLSDLFEVGLIDIGPTPMASELGIGNWIWNSHIADKQTCRLWHAVEIPDDTLVSKAKLRITADNGYRAFVDGEEIGRGGDFNNLTEYDVTALMTPGTHALAIEGFNDAANAGVILGMQIHFSNGKDVQILSDTSWFVVPKEEKKWEFRKRPEAGWTHSKVVAFAGRQVWQRPERIIASPPIRVIAIHFWQTGWFLTGLLILCVAGVAFSIWQALLLTVQTRSNHLLERERGRIARDLHDDLGAGLTQLTLLGELTQRESSGNTEHKHRLNDLCGKSRALLGSLDEIVWAVNPRLDTTHDFATFVCQQTQEYFSSGSIRCRLDLPDDLPSIPLDLPQRRNLLLAIKEALRNVAKHSQAKEVLLSIAIKDQQLTVSISDDGKGFSPKSVPTGRNGMTNMSERLSDIGGSCAIVSSSGKGTCVTCSLLLSKRSRIKDCRPKTLRMNRV